MQIAVDLTGGVYCGEPNADPEVRSRRDELMLSWAANVHGDSHSQQVCQQVALSKDFGLRLLKVALNPVPGIVIEFPTTLPVEGAILVIVGTGAKGGAAMDKVHRCALSGRSRHNYGDPERLPLRCGGVGNASGNTHEQLILVASTADHTSHFSERDLVVCQHGIKVLPIDLEGLGDRYGCGTEAADRGWLRRWTRSAAGRWCYHQTDRSLGLSDRAGHRHLVEDYELLRTGSRGIDSIAQAVDDSPSTAALRYVPIANSDVSEMIGLAPTRNADPMVLILPLLATPRSVFRSRAAVEPEILALLSQIGALQRAAQERPR